MFVYSKPLSSVEEIMCFNLGLQYVIEAECDDRDFKLPDIC